MTGLFWTLHTRCGWSIIIGYLFLDFFGVLMLLDWYDELGPNLKGLNYKSIASSPRKLLFHNLVIFFGLICQIQILHDCYSSNADSIYTVSRKDLIFFINIFNTVNYTNKSPQSYLYCIVYVNL